MKKALLVVDYTVDFVAEDGALTCGLPGIELESYICKITEQFIKDGEYVYFQSMFMNFMIRTILKQKRSRLIIYVERLGAIYMDNYMIFINNMLKIFFGWTKRVIVYLLGQT